MELDKDLASIQEARDLVKKAKLKWFALYCVAAALFCLIYGLLA